MTTRYFALVMGILFVMAGVGGFLPFVTVPMESDAPHLDVDMSYGRLLGLYPINLVHNIIHLLLGIWGIVAYRTYQQSRFYCQGTAIILTVFTLFGIIPSLSTVFGLAPMFSHDIWLHALEAGVAGYLGFIAPQTTTKPEPEYGQK